MMEPVSVWGERVAAVVTGIEQREHLCPNCQKSWQCVHQRLGRGCSSTVDGGRCPSCNNRWRMGIREYATNGKKENT